MAKVTAPFTPEQVVYLEIWQKVLPVHPFVCPFGGEHDNPFDLDLIPSIAGWACPQCGYTQDWCNDYMCEEPEFEVPNNPVMYELTKGILDRMRALYADQLVDSFLTLRVEATPRLAIMMGLARNLKKVIDLYESSHTGDPRSSKEDPSSIEGDAE